MTAEALIRTARSYVGHREVKPNSSPLIDHWLAGVALEPGQPWCAAFVCACIYETEPRIGFLRSGSALKLVARNPDRVISDPEPGCLVVEDHGHGLGHVSICTGLIKIDGRVTCLTCIAGNTSEDGKSRQGVMVAEHPHDWPDVRVVAFLRVCKPAVVA